MNRGIYRLVRSQTGLWVPAPEHTRSSGKGGKARKALLAASVAVSLFSANIYAADYQGLPNLCSTCGGAKAFVEYGLAKYGVNFDGNVGTISQVGDKAILNWQNFNIAPGNRVIFQRVADLLNLQAIDSASFSTLNRIWDQNPSVIAGQIGTVANQKANLMFINQNGIVFAKGAQVNVNQLTASALNINNDAFINNTYAQGIGKITDSTAASFRYGLDGVTENYGGFVKVLEGANITSDIGGRVMLIAPTVTNRGEISSPSGQTILAAGSKVYLQTSDVASLRGLLVQVDNSNLANGESKNTSIDKLLETDLSSYKLTKDKAIEVSDTKIDRSGVRHINVTAKYLNDSIDVLRDASGNPLLDGGGKQIPLHKAGDIVHAGDQVAIGDNVRAFTAESNYANDNYDNFGSATNIGAGVGGLTSNKGNITMVGLAVNQMGRATATSAYNYNGSIYLRAMSDPEFVANVGQVGKRAGRVILGENSLTQVLVDTSDTTKTTVAITPSTVDVVGSDIQVKSNAKVIVPSGIVNFSALEDPSKLIEFADTSTAGAAKSAVLNDPFLSSVNAQATQSRVLFESGSLIDVSGMNATESQRDNVLAITLYGAELADSPINRQSLRGKTVYVDVTKGSPLIANLAEYEANIAKTLEQRSTSAGSVRVQSTGQAIVQPNATFNLSGGTTTYQGGAVPTTSLVGADGKIYDISKATADTKFVGLANEFTQDEGWGQTGVYSRVQTTYSPGYVQGGDAGLMLANARTAYLAGNILASTTAGVRQLQTGQLPLSATLMLGFNKLPQLGAVAEYGLNQNVLIDGKISLLASNNTLTDDQVGNLHLDASMFGQGKIGRLEVNTNQNVNIDQSLKMADGGSVNINAANVNVNANITTTKANVSLNKATSSAALPVIASTKDSGMNADIQTQSGAININATNNLFNTANINTANTPQVILADNVKLSSTGFWINAQADLLAANAMGRLIDGGSINLTASFFDLGGKNLINSTVQLGAGSVLDVRGGAYRSFAGKNSFGTGGDITILATNVASADALQNHLKGESFGAAGKLSVTSDKVLIGAASPTALSIDSGFFNQGFASYALTGLSGLEIAENANIKVQTNNLILNQKAASIGNASNADSVGIQVLLDDSLRKAADLYLSATTRNESSNSTQAVLSDLKIDKGAKITTDIGANVNVLATNSVDIDGAINAAAGNINVTLDNGHNSNAVNSNAQRIHLGADAVLSAAGAAKLTRDAQGLNQGQVLKGGTVSLLAKDGYVDTEKTALIDVHGASPVEINIPNYNGSQGQVFASDAGSVNIQGLNGLYIDNNFNAKAGGNANLGGSVNIEIGDSNDSIGQGVIMHVGQLDAVSPDGNALRTAADFKQGYVAPAKLQAAGFETINLRSRDTIQFDQGGNLGATQPLYSVQLNASNIVTSIDGNSTINAKLVALGNIDNKRIAANNAPTIGKAKLNVNADYISLNGETSYSGFSDINLNSTGEVRLVGVQPASTLAGKGSINTLANVNIAANLIDPSSLTNFELDTNGVGDVRLSYVPRTSDILAYSAQGGLTINAKNIVQGGRIVVPFGKVTLNASDELDLEAGSITSVAAAPGQVIPFGSTLNGTTWLFDINTDGIIDAGEEVASLSGKAVSLDAKKVNIKSGATVDISAAGDIQANQFTVGSGGTTDLLVTKDYYAILPSFNGTVAPTDVLRDSPTNQPLVGTTIYLSGTNGLAAGNYVLMPAKYALLPGAYAVKVTGGVSDVLPGNSYLKSDGVAVVAGFLSDQRFTSADLSSARWSGFEVMSKNQVLDRAEYTLTNASTFFSSNDSSAHTQDAGLLQIAVKQSLAINGSLKTGAASGGVGAGLDISADNGKLAVLSASATASAQADEVVLDINQLNSLNVDSLLLGATRERKGNISTLTVKSNQVRVDNVASNGAATLQGREVMLAAKDDVVLQRNATIQATGSDGDAGTYKIIGDAAFVRAAATSAVLNHTGTTGSTGNISGDAGTSVLATKSIMLDASKNNLFLGNLTANGFSLPANLLLSANRMSVGNAPAGADGLNLTDDFLNTLANIENLTLRSYSSFDFYDNANLGSTHVDATTGALTYSVNNLSLEAADIRGYGNTANVANIQAQTLTFANPSNVASIDVGTGTGQLNVQSEKIYLGVGTKNINGFGNINITSAELLSKAGDAKQGSSGQLNLAANTQINTARMSGASASDQKITSTGNLSISAVGVGKTAATLAPLDTVANSWAVEAKNLIIDTAIQTISGDIALKATDGNLTLGQNAALNASGKLYAFNDKQVAMDAGSVSLTSVGGNIAATNGASVNVNSAAGGSAGQLTLSAADGNVDVASATLSGQSIPGIEGSGKSASVTVDAKLLTSFDQLNQQLNQAGFTEKRDFRLRAGDLNLTQASTGTIKANEVDIAVDSGVLTVDNTISASGAKGGSITLSARDDVKLTSNANLNATATTDGENGGKVTIGSTSGSLDLQSGQINVADSQGKNSGEVYLRASRTDTNVSVKSLSTEIQGAASVSMEGVKTYNNIDTLNSGANSSGSQLSVNTILADNTTFMNNKASVLAGLGNQVASLASRFHLLGGAEVRSDGDMTVASDLNFYQANRAGGEGGVLTLRANGNLNVNGSISDGLSTITITDGVKSTFSYTTTVADTQNSWSYRLVSGSDQSAANSLALSNTNKGDFTLASGKMIRTGTGDIDIAASGDFNMQSNTSAIYTVGRVADDVAGFNYQTATTANRVPVASYNFTQDGGDISINAKGNITSTGTDQLYSSWLFRQGDVNDSGNFDTTSLQTAWWVRPDQFQQGVATLGGGNLNVNAGGSITNLSLSAATNGRMAATTPSADKLVVLGGGDVNVTAGGDIVGGQYYTGKGQLVIETKGGLVGSAQKDGSDLYTTIALGDAQAVINAKKDINIEAVINPTMVVQTAYAGNPNITSSTSLQALSSSNVLGSSNQDNKVSTFSTYTDNTSISYQSLTGNIELHNLISSPTEGVQKAYTPKSFSWTANNYDNTVLKITPGGLKAYAYNGDITLDNEMSLYPSSHGAFELLAKNNVNITGTNFVQSDVSLDLLSDARSIVQKDGVKALLNVGVLPITHANTPVHINDTAPALIYALDGNVQGADSSVSANQSNLYLAKSVKVIAGNDYKNLGLTAQNMSAKDVTLIKAGRDIIFDQRVTNSLGLNLGGSGLFELEAGRDVDLGSSKGITSSGNQSNIALPVQGADISVAVGVPNGVDYEGAISRLLSKISSAKSSGVAVDDNTLWQARWLTGNDALVNDANALLSAIQEVQAQGDVTVRQSVSNMFFTALRETGRDYNNPKSEYAGQYTRGYSAVELLFPNISEKNADGSSKYYAGNLSLPLTSIKTASGGNIDFMVPGGQALIGYTNISDTVLNTYGTVNKGDESGIERNLTTTGIVASSTGSIRGFTLDDILVNQSRILTVAGGDILLWSSEGNIDAGKGKRTALVAPPPLVSVDSNGNIVVTLLGAATGSGIGALGDGNVDLIAPKGSVDAGDAGVRAKNINIAAQTVLNAGNITATGSATGTQVAVAGALNSTLTGAANAGDPGKAISEAVKNSMQPAEPFTKPPSPSFINVEVVSIGE